MDQTERPIHCTDVKRQTLYVKDANGWGKEESCEKIKHSISKIADDHMSYFSKNYPTPISSDEQKTHHSIICEVSQNVEDNDKAMDKSVRTIAEWVTIDSYEHSLRNIL
jgi:methionine salvage enolase-phosphatase E1